MFGAQFVTQVTCHMHANQLNNTQELTRVFSGRMQKNPNIFRKDTANPEYLLEGSRNTRVLSARIQKKARFLMSWVQPVAETLRERYFVLF
jgi:hypothetical protein